MKTYQPKQGLTFATNYTTEKIHVGMKRNGGGYKTFCEGRSPRYAGPLTTENVNEHAQKLAIEGKEPIFCKRCLPHIIVTES
jgi:hypothetical protein